MTRLEILAQDFENEVTTTRKFLALVPDDKFDWKPHPKSMTIKQLTTHIAELPEWVGMTFETDSLDFANSPYQPADIKNRKALQEFFEKNVETAGTYFAHANNENKLDEIWVLKEGENIYGSWPKAGVVRMSINQTIHHRAQLGVFLRLLNIPIPGSYGPSADEH
ncbi:MAG: DinB family protein [Niabella sp.]